MEFWGIKGNLQTPGTKKPETHNEKQFGKEPEKPKPRAVCYTSGDCYGTHIPNNGTAYIRNVGGSTMSGTHYPAIAGTVGQPLEYEWVGSAMRIPDETRHYGSFS